MRALGVLFVLLLVVAAIGWFRGWFRVETSLAGGRDEVALRVDRERIEDVARRAKAKIEALVDDEGDGWDGLAAQVVSIDVPARELGVRVAGMAVVLSVAADVVVVDGDRRVALAELRVGEAVRVTTARENGRSVVVRLERS